MSRLVFTAGALAGVLLTAFACTVSGTLTMAADASEPKLVHNVYFTLKDGSPENVRQLTDACYKYLDNHDGVAYFAAGTVVDELQRPVNQRDFHVCLCVVFKNKAAHDVYQTHPRHLAFIDENKATWDKVRVFDSWGK
jgi:hypothetical protein